MELIFSKTYGQLRLEFCSCFTALSWYIIWLSVPLSFLQKVEDAEDSRTRKVILFFNLSNVAMWLHPTASKSFVHIPTHHHRLYTRKNIEKGHQIRESYSAVIIKMTQNKGKIPWEKSKILFKKAISLIFWILCPLHFKQTIIFHHQVFSFFLIIWAANIFLCNWKSPFNDYRLSTYILCIDAWP